MIAPIKKRFHRQSPEETTKKYLLMCSEIWGDVHKSIVGYEALPLEVYTYRYNTMKFPKDLLAPILLSDTPPTLADAEKLRQSINAWHSEKRKGIRKVDNAEAVAIAYLEKKGYQIAKRTTKREREAIALLKSRGYQITKTNTQYITL